MIDRCHLTSYIQKFSWRFHEGNICFKRLHALHWHQGVHAYHSYGAMAAGQAALVSAAAGSGTFSLFQNDGWLVVINHSVGICSLLVSTYSLARTTDTQ